MTKTILESHVQQGHKLNLKVVGMLTVESGGSVDLFRRAVESVKVYGIIKADNNIKLELINTYA